MFESYLSQKVCFQVENYCFIFCSSCFILRLAAVSCAEASLRDVESHQTLHEYKLKMAKIEKQLQKSEERFNQLLSIVSSLFIDTQKN